MLDALRFVAAAVAKKDYVQGLTHFKIKDGRVTGFNGDIALSSDIDVDLDIYPNASKLLAAIKACASTIALNMTPGGKLSVKSGKFKSLVECMTEDAAVTYSEPEGESVELNEAFYAGLKALAPVMGIDASRPWAMGIKVQSGSMLATNNVMLAEYWHGLTLPFDAVIPDIAINELLRIGEPPTKVQITDHSISFRWGEKKWLWSKLIEGDMWPVARVQDIMSTEDGPQLPFPAEFFDAVETLKPFLLESNSLYLTSTSIATSRNDGEGTSIEIDLPVVTEMQSYQQKQLSILGQVAQTIDWSAYPRPCIFRGKNLRGALVGQKV
ncbi:DNA polymerase beta subunit protein [Rhizobium phage RHph_Y55]|nr:DNA polymerase beta subunit protein [Rhizobium phage RHph_Y55]